MKMSIYPAVKKLTENDLFEMVKNGLQRELEGLRLYRKELERNQKLYDENQRLREALGTIVHEINEALEYFVEENAFTEIRAIAQEALGWEDE